MQNARYYQDNLWVFREHVPSESVALPEKAARAG